MEVVWAKVTAMSILGIVSLILGLLPLKVGPKMERHPFMRNTVISMLLCFGGGVLMATCFTHILPEVIESFESVEATEHKPIGEIVFCAGFFLIYFLEELVHRTCDRQEECDEDEGHLHHKHSVHRSFSIHAQSCEAGHNELREITQVEDAAAVVTANGSSLNSLNETRKSVAFDISMKNNVNEVDQPIEQKKSQDQSLTDLYEHLESSDEAKRKLTFNATTIRDFFTVLALSFHALFEGLAVGLEEDAEGVWKLFAGVATHKFVMSFCVGLEVKLAGETPTVLYVIYMTTFALVTPIGMIIGTVISEYKTEDIAYVISIATLQGLAAGTILYVVVFEVLQRERSKIVSGLVQLFFVVAGFSAMMCIDLFAGHEHDHDHDDHEEIISSTLTTTFSSTTL